MSNTWLDISGPNLAEHFPDAHKPATTAEWLKAAGANTKFAPIPQDKLP